MKAAVHSRYGPPDTIELTEVDAPTPADNEVLVRVHATTVNRTDCGILRGKPWFARLFYGIRRPKSPVLGNEFAGRVGGIWNQVTQFAVGDDVVGYNDVTYGAHAEYITMPETKMIAYMPAGLTYEEAAPIAEGAHYALSIIRAAKIGPGQRVLIYGATGAIGSAPVLVAKHFGATVTAVCATPHLELVRSLGADKVIDYTTEDFTRAGTDYAVVIDAVGKSSFGACKKLLKADGIYTSTGPGPFWQNPALVLWTKRFGDRRVIFPLPRNDQADLVFLTQLVASGEFRPLIDRRYSLDNIVDAFRYVETGQKVGNVVITVDRRNEVQDSSATTAPTAG
ncbi:MAG: NAD(P)-dependent alcohol dehydrogenase [Chloroflexota bacterium]|nr:NAD(P)-dependent alcohol dehydrogenase [Chloroflexota bacterium]